MARTIRLTRVSQTTKVEVFEGGVLSHQIACNEEKDFVDDQTGPIRFPCDKQLDALNLNVNNLHADTVTALGTPTTSSALFAALVAGKFFNPRVA